MFTYYITGNTFDLKDELKLIKPKRKDFKSWWRYNYSFKCWELNVPNGINTKKYCDSLETFCKKHLLKLEVLEFTKTLTKSINDFNSAEEYFQYFHRHNQKNYNFKR